MTRSASGLLANVFPSAMADVVDPPRCIATVRLPCQVGQLAFPKQLSGRHSVCCGDSPTWFMAMKVPWLHTGDRELMSGELTV